MTGDLVGPDWNTDGIQITTHDVGIDLNNFTIIGVGCVGATTGACRPTSGTGSSVDVDNVYSRHGISTATGCLVQRNTVRGNTGYGLSLGTATAYRENVINDNTGGTVTGGFNAGANTCGAAFCP